MIATVHTASGIWDTNEANVDLMVAAPELLDFVQVMSEIHDSGCQENQEILGRCRCHVPRAKELLIKARGEQHG